MRLQSIAAKTTFIGFLLAALLAGIAVGGTRLGLWDVSRGYHLMAPATVLGALAFTAGMLWLILALRLNSGTGKRLGLIGLIGAGLLLYGPVGFVVRSLTLAPIHDATTDPEHSPAFVALRAKAEPAPAYGGGEKIRFRGRTVTLAWLQHEYYPELAKPNAILITPAQLFWRGFESAKAMGWNIVSFDAKEGRIEAVATSLWFGRKTDIVIRVKPAGTLGARLDLRCKSRDGLADANVACIKSYVKYVKELTSR